jgi:tetratricopeptide (TPR) repeat protein
MDPQIKHHLTVGRDFYQAGEYDRAKPHLEAVVESHADFADVHNMLGVIHYEAGRPSKARESFERALEINPRYTEAALNLAVCYNELGRYDDAKRVYSRAQGTPDGGGLDKLDHFVRGKIANMHADLGDAYVAVGLLDHAVKEYRKALRVCPTFVDIRTKLATTLRDQGRVAESLDELIAIRESAPDFLQARVHLGVTLWRAGRVPEARKEWEHVLAADPNNRSCRVYLRMTEDARLLSPSKSEDSGE